MPLFYFFFIFLIKLNATENIIFPFENKIYSFDIDKQNFTILYKTKNIFLKDFYFYNNSYFFIEKNNQILKLLSFNISNSKSIVKEIFSGEYSTIIVTKDYLITFSKYLKNNKFEVLLFNIKGNKRVLSFELDLFISDYEIIDDNIVILAGNNITDENNFIIAIDCNNRKKIELLKNKKDNDFFKILTDKNFIYIYNSSMPNKNKNKHIYKIDKKNYKKIFSKDFDIKEKKYYYLYGKGFYHNNEIFLPCIDDNYDVVMFKVNKELKIIKKIFFGYGIYKVLKNSNNLYFIAYNYYKEAKTFYFGFFDYNSDKIKLKILN